MPKKMSVGNVLRADFRSPLRILKELRKAAGDKPKFIGIAWERENGNICRYDIPVPARIRPDAMKDVKKLVERTVKFLLWSAGGWRLYISGPAEIVQGVADAYTPTGARAFDYEFFTDLYGRPVEVKVVPFAKMPAQNEKEVKVENNTNGYRIGFDLGASDFKISALKNGRVVFSKEFPWDPRPQGDPEYHYQKLTEGLNAAKDALGGRVDAIGGSTAGTLVGKKLGVASLIRGVKEKSPDKYETAQNIFARIEEDWKVPFEIFNDGDVTALAAAITMKPSGGILGVAMGSSEAAGYITPRGTLTGRITELAFAPVDMNPNAGRCEWSGDYGVGAMYFSQQAVNYLAQKLDFKFHPNVKLPERLKQVQTALETAKNETALVVFLTIGRYLAEAAAWYHEFYDYSNLMILGRVTSGLGGSIILHNARLWLQVIDPELFEKLSLFMPDDKTRRLGQSVAAAQIPTIAGAPKKPVKRIVTEKSVMRR